MSRILFISLFLMIGICPTSARAQAQTQTSEPYSLQLTLTSRSEAELKGHLQTGLKQILVQKTQAPEILNTAPIIEALDHPEWYITQFAYLGSAPHIKLKLQFNASLIEQLIHLSGKLPADNFNERMLVWVVESTASGIFWRDSSEYLNNTQANLAFKPLRPMLDAQDWHTTSPVELWDASDKQLADLGTRYGCHNHLIIKLNVLDKSQHAAAVLFYQNTRSAFDLKDEHRASVIKSVLLQASQVVARTHQPATATPNPEPLEKVELAVLGIDNPGKYARVVHYFKQAPIVKSVELSRLTPEYTVFRLEVEGGEERLAKLLQTSGPLQALPYLAAEPEVMAYKLKP